MANSDKHMKGRRKKTFKWKKEKISKLKTEEEVISNLKKAYEDVSKDIYITSKKYLVLSGNNKLNLNAQALSTFVVNRVWIM